MVSKKGKKRIEYKGRVVYWFVRKNSANVPMLHILSEDKKISLEQPCGDSEKPVASYIRHVLDQYYESEG